MATVEQNITNYKEAKEECEKYINYKGDKRGVIYKRMSHDVVDLWIGRMNFLAKQLNLPNFLETFYKQ